MGFYFDTVVTIVLYGAPEGLLDEIWADCARYEQLLSKTIQGSDVDRINHAGGQPVQVDHETWEILRRAVEVSDSSGHDFSVTIAPLTALWDFTDGTNRMPTDEERLAALPLVNDDLLVLGENDTVTLPEGMEVDLGGIAKGYIADQIARSISEGMSTRSALSRMPLRSVSASVIPRAVITIPSLSYRSRISRLSPAASMSATLSSTVSGITTFSIPKPASHPIPISHRPPSFPKAP